MPQIEISTDPARLNLDVIHSFLTNSYWSRGIPRETVKRAIAGSLCFGLYVDSQLVGFARVVTDRATFAWLADVFILESHRGQGLSKRLIQAVMSHRDLEGLRRWILATSDAHGLYSQFGFKPPAHPDRYMEIARPNICLESAQ